MSGATLAFDTATAACSVAVARADGDFAEVAPEATRIFEQPAHTTELLPSIEAALAQAEIRFEDLSQVIVGIGPGAFTGLRIGVATARAIASARGLPLVPISSLAALAHAAGSEQMMLPVIDARRSEFYFRTGEHDRVAPADALLDAARACGAELAFGDGAVKLAAEFGAAGIRVPDVGDPRHVVRAASLIALATAGESVPVDQVVPNYIREPDAKVSARERWLVAGATQ